MREENFLKKAFPLLFSFQKLLIQIKNKLHRRYVTPDNAILKELLNRLKNIEEQLDDVESMTDEFESMISDLECRIDDLE